MDDLYALLGVSKTASAEQIKKAYRDAAFKWHPDRNPGDTTAEEKFKQINAAYSVLGDETKRAQYNQYGSTDAYANAHSDSSYGQYGPTGDPFWDWFYPGAGPASDGHTGGRHYTYTWQQQGAGDNFSFQARPQGTPGNQIMRGALSLLAGIIFFRFSWFILPFGPILCLAAVINGIRGIIRGLSRLFAPKKTDETTV
ncbi:MAG: DnaJ domain-containing protein [Spirochaetaceae bacterium]|nr:DnaJ domain-containing protein [Spirochaetaceae bacterium]